MIIFGQRFSNMSLFTTSLNSGSNGNCYYIGNETEAILIDAGLSCRETEKRMQQLGLSLKKVKAVFVSHEHTDHIKGIDVLAEKHGLTVHLSRLTLQRSGLRISNDKISHWDAAEPVRIGKLTITPFQKYHDAADPYSFTVSDGLTTIGIFTDIGRPCNRLKKHFRLCHAAYLETNYDEDMLENGTYPLHLKNRIRGGHGHLSNRQALELFIKHKPAFMTHLFPSHLSRENNSPTLVKKMFEAHAGGTEIIVASRYGSTAVYHITGIGNPAHLSTFAPQLKLF